jgi:hypothetical protein
MTNHPDVVTDHVVTLTGLAAGTQFFYETGSPTNWFAGTTNHYFITAPLVGTPQPTRIWVLGDSGYAGADANAVRDAYATLDGSRPTDVLLMLGDNAYENGTDAEHQAAVFNTYGTFLRKVAPAPVYSSVPTGGSLGASLTPDGVKFAVQGGADAWDANRYLNLWVCHDLQDASGRSLLGYAQFPGGPAATDGVVIVHTAFGTTGTAAGRCSDDSMVAPSFASRPGCFSGGK